MGQLFHAVQVWDPTLIIAQIISIQCLFYLTLGICQALFLGPHLGRLTVAYVFGWRHMSFHTYLGWMTMLSNLLVAPMSAVYLMWIVERAKKCLDFASTCYVFHFITCWIHSGFPASLEWWATNVVGLLIMSLMGEWLCVRREMQDIPMNALRNRAAVSSPSSGGVGSGSGRQAAATSTAVQLTPLISSSGSGTSGGTSSAEARNTSTARLLGAAVDNV